MIRSVHEINRIFVKTGLEVINTTERVGLASLYEKAAAKSRGGGITAEDIAFRLVPRINAAGRMEHAGAAVEVLTCDTGKTADALTDTLEANNNQRKTIQKELLSIASELAQTKEYAENKSLVLAGSNWHAGVIGIVASQLCEKYGKPTLMLSIDKKSMKAKGSGRSIQGIHLFDALENCHELLEKFGGHANAVGFTIEVNKIKHFSQAFEKTIRDMLKEESVQLSLEYDDAYQLQSVFNNSFLEGYVKLAPFGRGNPEPVFVSNNVTFNSARIVGENHLKFTVTDNGKMIDGIGFGFGFLLPKILTNSVSIAYNIRCNTFRGGEKWEMNLVDIKM